MVIEGFKGVFAAWVGWGDSGGEKEQVHELVWRSLQKCGGTQSGKSTEANSLQILVGWWWMDLLSAMKQWLNASVTDPCLRVLSAVQTPSAVSCVSQALRGVNLFPLVPIGAVGPSLCRLAGSGLHSYLTPSRGKCLSLVWWVCGTSARFCGQSAGCCTNTAKLT